MKDFKSALRNLCRKFFIDAFTGMALGLFCTLIAGTIVSQIAGWIGTESAAGRILGDLGAMAKTLMGAGIGIGIAYKLKSPPLVIFSASVAGFAGAFADKLILGKFVFAMGFCGNPIGAYIVSLAAVEIVNIYAGKTRFDILLIPLGTVLVSMGFVYVAWPFIKLVELFSVGIEAATTVAPFFMGIIIAVVMGVLLTMPTSSAAIWIAIALGNNSDSMLLAGGAAVVGCAAQMVGFGVMSYRENGFGGLIAQGLGTSMLQIPNIMKHPLILIPPVLTSAILGPVATCLFHLRCNASGGGMGTSGLVGVFGTVDASSGILSGFAMWTGIILLLFVLPALLTWVISFYLRKKGWIKEGDMKLPE
jgi:uncharacterized membrane protein